MKQTTNTRHILPLTALAALAFAANPAQAAISVINEDFGVKVDGSSTADTLETIPHTVSFDAGAADKLIVTLNAETGGGYGLNHVRWRCPHPGCRHSWK